MGEFWTGAGSGALAGGGGLIGGILAHQQWKKNRQDSHWAVSLRRRDLERAGINPILAPQMMGGSIGSQGTTQTDFGGSSAATARQQARATEAGIRKTDAEVELINKQAQEMDGRISKVALENATTAQQLQEIAQRMAFLRTKQGREALHQSILGEGKTNFGRNYELMLSELAKFGITPESILATGESTTPESVKRLLPVVTGGAWNLKDGDNIHGVNAILPQDPFTLLLHLLKISSGKTPAPAPKHKPPVNPALARSLEAWAKRTQSGKGGFWLDQ